MLFMSKLAVVIVPGVSMSPLRKLIIVHTNVIDTYSMNIIDLA